MVILWWRAFTGFAGLPRVAVCLALMSCATTNLSPFGTGGTATETEKDEKQLWQTAEQLEQRIDNSGRRYKNPELDAYLTAVARKLLPPDAQVPALDLESRSSNILS